MSETITSAITTPAETDESRHASKARRRRHKTRKASQKEKADAGRSSSTWGRSDKAKTRWQRARRAERKERASVFDRADSWGDSSRKASSETSSKSSRAVRRKSKLRGFGLPDRAEPIKRRRAPIETRLDGFGSQSRTPTIARRGFSASPRVHKAPSQKVTGREPTRSDPKREMYEYYKALGMLWRYFQIYPEG